jgi:hypothetical protein
MTETGNDRPRLAGGIFIALGLLVGAIVGVAIDQPSAGMITGFAIGAGIALTVWLVDRRKA